MTSGVVPWLAGVPWIQVLELLIDVTLKGALICAAAGIATLLLRRSSAFTRNMVWVFALIGVMLLPAFTLFSPAWNLAIIPDLSSWGGGSYTPDYVKADPEPFVGPLVPSEHAAASPVSGTDEASTLSLPWYIWAILVWLAGAFVCLTWCLISHAGVRYLVRQARPASREWHAASRRIAAELDLGRDVHLLESEQIKAAITVGIFRPTVVLPAGSDDWSGTRRHLVLSHELAHVKRWDTLVETLALCVTAVYWFNPLVWFAVKQLRIERERDCDNAVLGTGAKPSDYAELLMNIAADLGDSARPVWQLSTISQGSNLKDRLMSILNKQINRSRGGRRSAFLTGALVLALILPISTSGLWNAQAQEEAKKAKQEKAKQEQATQEALEKAEKERAKQKAKMEAKQELMEQKKAEMKLKQEQLEKEKAKMKAEKQYKVKMSAEEKLHLQWKKICSNENSAACKIGTIMKKKGPEAGVTAFHKMKKPGAGDYLFDEKEFNTLGYLFLYDQKIDEAIAVFKMNVEEYPDSWNVYDSLGEAYLVAGKYKKSEKYYKKALAMNPEAESAKKGLHKIQVILSDKS